jgi:hypothetical protein
MMPCCRAAALVFAALLTLRAQAPPDPADCLDALARTAATFASTAPRLMAEETLKQRGRRSFVEVFRSTKEDEIKNLDIQLPLDFQTHEVVSSWGLAPMGDAQVLHEIRKIVSMDGEAVSDATEARHAMTIGLQSSDDRTKRQLLEDFENSALEGAVTDFGQVILLFEKRRQKDYDFTLEGERHLGAERAAILHYRQISGRDGLTVFKERTAQRQPIEGEIWLRMSDLLPVRVTMNTVEALSKRYRIRTEATVDYTPSKFGLVPVSVKHKQYLNGDLMVENDLHYVDFERAEAMVP